MSNLLFLDVVNDETHLISLRAYYFSRVTEYWREIRSKNFNEAHSIYRELQFYSDNQQNLWFDGMSNLSRRAGRRTLFYFMPAILGAILVGVLVFISYKKLLPVGTTSQISYNINLIELLVGGAVAFAALLASSTYTIKSILRDGGGGDGDGKPPTDLRPFPLPPSPDKLREMSEI